MKSLIFPWRTDIHHQQVRLAFKEAIGQLFRPKVVSAPFHLGEERFAVGEWTEVEGLPMLVDAQARLVCQQDGFMNYGTHGIFIGRVICAEVAETVAPLLYVDGAYRQLGA